MPSCLDRILGREHHERLLQLPGLVADGDLALLHRFEQRALHLGGSPVDLVGQQEIREHRPLPGHEGLVALVVDEGSDQVRRQQVGSELDARETGPHAFGDALGEQRLRDPGHALDEQVAAGEQADQHPLHDSLLPDHDPAELGGQAAREGRTDLRNVRGELAGFSGAWHASRKLPRLVPRSRNVTPGTDGRSLFSHSAPARNADRGRCR